MSDVMPCCCAAIGFVGWVWFGFQSCSNFLAMLLWGSIGAVGFAWGAWDANYDTTGRAVVLARVLGREGLFWNKESGH